MKQAIIYTRFSPRPDAENCDSCEKQEERCLAYCHEKVYSVHEVFKDRAVSGGVINRPDLARALSHLKEGCVLIVDRPDRLSRELLDTLLIRKQVESVRATIEFADGSPSGVGSPEEVFFSNVMAALAAYERDRIVHRCKEGKKKSRKEGKFCGGKLKIGWKKDPENPGKVMRCEVERLAIIHACRIGKLHTSEFIAQKLTTEFGLCRGEPWSSRTVRKIIARESFWAGPNGNFLREPTHP